MRYCLVVVVFLFCNSVQAQNCRATSEVQLYVDNLEIYFKSAYAWPGYNLKQNIHVIADLKTNNHCAFLIENGIVSQVIETSENIVQSMLSDDEIEKMIPGGLTPDQHAKYKKNILDSILTPSWSGIPPTGAMEFGRKWAIELRQIAAGIHPRKNLYYVGIHEFSSRLSETVGVAHHEGFHHFFQRQAGSWPVWDIQPDRNSLGNKCYIPNSDVKKLYVAEKTALINAVEAEFAGNDILRTNEIGTFKATRIVRYELLKKLGVTVKSGPSTISCDEAEAIMEIEEGLALFIETSANLAVRVWKEDDVIDYFRLAPDLDPFYVLGAAQTYLLWKQKGLADLQKELSASTTWRQGLFSYF